MFSDVKCSFKYRSSWSLRGMVRVNLAELHLYSGNLSIKILSTPKILRQDILVLNTSMYVKLLGLHDFEKVSNRDFLN